MFINREMKSILIQAAQQFPVVGIIGPRQSGKTTLAREVFSEYAYVTLEDIDVRIQTQEDPRRFLAAFAQGKGVIIDEAQNAPELFSYLQGVVDQAYRPGFFVIIGSQNFLMHEKITQTLAGRIALLTLLPLTVQELNAGQHVPLTLEEVMFKGLYPRIYASSIDIEMWFSNYIATYVERDVRQIINIGNVIAFQKLLRLCATRTGSLLNYADLARDCDISANTTKAWLSLLEASYIIRLVQPYYKNFSKRVVKSPKIYFYDPGLVCALLGIKNAQELYLHPMRGQLFETLIMSELHKHYYNRGKNPPIYFWRDTQGYEIDCILERSAATLIPVEIKSGMTMQPDFFKGINAWHKIVGQESKNSYVVYAGTMRVEREHGKLIPWNNISQLIEDALS